MAWTRGVAMATQAVHSVSPETMPSISLPKRWFERASRRRALLRAARQIRRSGLFDSEWYRRSYPDVDAGGLDPALHYLRHGAAEGRDPGPAFGTRRYEAANPDVRAAGLNALLHFLGNGQFEGRRLHPATDPGPTRPKPPTWRGRVRRAVLRPTHAMVADIERPGGELLLASVLGRPPRGWALVTADPELVASGAALRITAGGRSHEIGLADLTRGRHRGLLRLPDGAGHGPSAFALVRPPREDGVARPTAAGPAVTVREIGRAEALARAMVRAARADSRTLRDLAAAHAPAVTGRYVDWVARYDTPTDADLARLHARAAAVKSPPQFSVLVPVYETPEPTLRAMLASVRAQTWPHWELCLADDGSVAPHVRVVLEEAATSDSRVKLALRPRNGNISAASNTALALASGDWVALLDHDDVLAPHALQTMADAIAVHPGSDLFYSDEDKLDATGQRHDPYFKPDFSMELLRGQNFVSHLGVYRATAVRAAGGFRVGYEGSQDYDLTLRVVARTRAPVIHVPHVLYHWRMHPSAATFSTTQIDRATNAARRALHEQAFNLGETVTVTGGIDNYHRVVPADPQRWPRVSVIVPTRDGLDLLRTCVDGLLERTTYDDLELIVVDNGSSDPATLAYLGRLSGQGAVVLRDDGAFNYARLNNRAAAIATGDILLLLNNDVAVTEPGWLREMVRAALRPGVGAVGARLLYPDGTVQHAGVVLGLGGVAGHVCIGAAAADPGPFGLLHLSREVGAVTGACMAVPRAAWNAVGGMDEDNLAVAFNDVDLCLRLREAGYRIVFTPYAELIHHESKSRGSDFADDQVARFMAEIAYMQRRWATELARDPFFSLNHSLDLHTPTLAFPPRVPRPWHVA